MTQEKIDLKVEVTTRPHLAYRHLLNATLLCRLIEPIEKLDYGAFKYLQSAYNAFVMGSILSAVSYLEAVINELYLDAVEDQDSFKGIPDTLILSKLADWWTNKQNRRNTTLIKYKKFLEIAVKPKINNEIYQEVELITIMRNELTHYKPKVSKSTLDFNTFEIIAEDKMSNKLFGKFPLNPHIPFGNAFFPDKCLGFGCAEWVNRNIIQFVEEFYEIVGMENKIQEYSFYVKPHINTSPEGNSNDNRILASVLEILSEDDRKSYQEMIAFMTESMSEFEKNTKES